ncbi:Formate dehydrogenase, cytochrome b556(fdo) subunit [Roseivivax jejudonensis]|uniref:Formate dehydrogenase, cytochrome b556(Fdo) subunit n=1 Tax=Roseivivax jejudonensis TaxID=1529041 RepID=A0A1X7A860_9RHOB|nr:formate dehydrogenase subunit gamma [Roseivivax jejudonensis]SLN72637.1 Formate dehydrogenase, cytochrome b556(fdo) subunit [Roseivivax jejudonensis]
MTRILSLLLLLVLMQGAVAPASAQAVETPDSVEPATEGNTPTLEDILRRQEGLEVDQSGRAAEVGEDVAPGADSPLGTLGGASDADLWRAFRFDNREITTQVRGPAADVIMQDRGMAWLQFREGPLITYGGWLLLGTIILLAVFYLLKGRIRIDGTKTGRRILRFTGVERFGHWLLAGSFILLGITGLLTLMGRKFLIPAFGHEAFATMATASKWIHNNVSWAFMLALVWIFVAWVWHNLPDRTDIKWLAKGGGLLVKGHPPAKKFNAGQKLIFWSVIVLGASISASGLALLFPFELPMFAATFEKINAVGVPMWFGFDPLPTQLSPHAEMQYSQLWHAIVSFVLMAIVLAHIYIGSIGMEGAFDAMGRGDVEEQWAAEHHSIWYEEKRKEGEIAPQGTNPGATPAE